jgi:hypothetical protein
MIMIGPPIFRVTMIDSRTTSRTSVAFMAGGSGQAVQGGRFR